jgi:hypothetical protein
VSAEYLHACRTFALSASATRAAHLRKSEPNWAEELINSTGIGSKLRVLVRLAVEEIEAFYLGDLRALERAFPEADMRRARAYVPDSICGTWELFGKIVRDGGGNKVAWAEAMGPRLTTQAERSRSPSFRLVFRRYAALSTA